MFWLHKIQRKNWLYKLYIVGFLKIEFYFNLYTLHSSFFLNCPVQEGLFSKSYNVISMKN